MSLLELIASDSASVFLDTTSGFATVATYGGNSHDVLFNKSFNEIDPVTGVVYEGLSLSIQGLESVFGSATRDQTVAVDGTTYYVVTVEPALAGMVTVKLSTSAQHG